MIEQVKTGMKLKHVSNNVFAVNRIDILSLIGVKF